MAEGIRKAGDRVTLRAEDTFAGLAGDVGVFYGLEGRMPRIFNAYAEQGRALYVDLGYWGRREGGRWAGYHKVVVNARHPVGYYRTPQHAPDRCMRFGIQLGYGTPRGELIVLAGMSDKGAYAEGLEPESWERETLAKIQAVTDRTVLYRPKPSWKAARPIAGTLWSPPAEPIEAVLAKAYAVVTHHSNVAVDAVVAGVPAWCWGGVAREMSNTNLNLLAYACLPVADEARLAWMADVAYTQWSIAEMRDGAPWRHLLGEGLI